MSALKRSGALWARLWGSGWRRLSSCLTPMLYLLGGGVSAAWKHFAPAMMAEIERRSFAYRLSKETTRIARATLEATRGLYGAASLSLRHQSGRNAVHFGDVDYACGRWRPGVGVPRNFSRRQAHGLREFASLLGNEQNWCSGPLPCGRMRQRCARTMLSGASKSDACCWRKWWMRRP